MQPESWDSALAKGAAGGLAVTVPWDRARPSLRLRPGQPRQARIAAAGLSAGCNLCHSVTTAGIERITKSEKIAGPDLAGVLERNERGWVVKWLKREVERNEKMHTLQFTGTDEELGMLLDWLARQKTP
jgi:hypothetical protein